MLTAARGARVGSSGAVGWAENEGDGGQMAGPTRPGPGRLAARGCGGGARPRGPQGPAVPGFEANDPLAARQRGALDEPGYGSHVGGAALAGGARLDAAVLESGQVTTMQFCSPNGLSTYRSAAGSLIQRTPSAR